MEKSKRIRLVFNEEILSEAQKLDGLARCWVLLKSQDFDAISDVVSHLLDFFQLRKSCPDGLVLSISGFVLPPFESSCILKDNEIIRVKKKKKDILRIEGNEAGKLKDQQKILVDNGYLLLQNEEFDKQKCSNGSEDLEEDSVDTDEESHSSSSHGSPKNRKRKAAEKLFHSKEKKRRPGASGSAAEGSIPEKLDNIVLENTHGNGEEKADSGVAKDNMVDSDMKRNSTVEENGKETPDAKLTPNITKKGPSRSARRKYAKRRWLREMAKIKMQNSTCEPEGLRNWKEDQEKAKGNKHKWNKIPDDLDTHVQDGEPKGLLHWKPSSQNAKLRKAKKRGWNKDHHHQPSFQASDASKWKNQLSDENLQPTGTSSGLNSATQEKGDALEEEDETTEEETEVVPIVIRPGHIRFEPLETDETVRKEQVPMQETFQWNGITSKKKGQRWGMEKPSSSSQSGCKNLNKDDSHTLCSEKEKLPDCLKFDELPPLSLPKEGDLIAYRVLELSSTWTPELSDYRVGKVSYYNNESNQIVLLPVQEYPFFPDKTDGDDAVQPENSLYKEDGSLEIDVSSLVDVRMVKNGSSESTFSARKLGLQNLVNGSTSNENAQIRVEPISGTEESSHGKEVQLAATGTDILQQLSEAVAAKKEELSRKAPEKGSSENRSWSYKALRSSALGPTMAILRSKKDI